jgi:leader peptidase (prepilin peptidase)/N-methyltransferase
MPPRPASEFEVTAGYCRRTVPSFGVSFKNAEKVPILTIAPLPLWLGLVAAAPAAAWAIERGAARVEAAPVVAGSPSAAWLATLAAALAIGLLATAAFTGIDAGLAALLGWVLLALARIDASHGLLPDCLTAPLAAAGLAVAGLDPAARGPSLGAAVVGAVAGFATLALIAAAYRRWRGRDGMGLGDAKLLGAVGAWLGATALPLTVCLAATGALVAVAAARRFGWRLERDGAVPFGPFLCLAAWIVFLTRSDMLW